jgi:sec-independent protein translocase protein TatC
MDREEAPLESKPFLEHLEDLRVLIIKSVIALGLGMVICFVLTKPILQLLMKPLRDIGQDPKNFLRVLGVIDPFSIQIEIALCGGVILTLPFILYFTGQFVLPALTKKEKGYLLPVFAAGTVLFLVGVAFCYFVLLGQTLKFFLQYNEWLGFRSEWTIQNYIDFVVQMLVGFGLAFELPLVILILNFFGIVTHRMLREYRRHAIVCIVIAASCIMPTYDLISLLLLCTPMYVLYELCVIITWYRERKNPPPDRELFDADTDPDEFL